MNTPNLSSLPRRPVTWVAAALALAGLLAVAHGTAEPASSLVLKHDASPVARGQLERASFADIVKRVSPSVVKITAQTAAHHVRMNGQFPGMDDPFFRQFFGGRLPEMQTPAQTGIGSGVVISADGYIATNNHVVDGAEHLQVTFEDGREFTARVVGRDPLTDIAVVKVDAKDLPALTFADSSKTEVGDRVLAIGNPFGIGETVTSGIVSAKGRRVGILSDVKGYENFIQTDAAINPGNSGGALVDVDGRLVGINTAILSHSGGFQGVGLAVPSDLVGQVAESLVKTGHVVRGFLGVQVQDISPALADSFGLKNRNGALVAEVQSGGPAAKADLREGDVITGVNGHGIDDANRLTLAVSAVAPGSKVNLEILRDGKSESLNITAGERPDAHSNRPLETAGKDDEGVLNGVAVGDLDGATRREMGLPERVKGALITEVEPDSAAARAGLSAGDVILELNRHKVASADEAVELNAKAESRKTLLKLWSHGATIFVVVDETEQGKPVS